MILRLLVLPYNLSALPTELGPVEEDAAKLIRYKLMQPKSVRTELKLVPEQGTLKKGAFKKGRKGIESSRVSDVIFADIIGSANDNDDMQIKVAEGNFTPSNKRHKSGVSGQGKQRRNTGILHIS